MTTWLAVVDRMFQALIRAREWAPVEMLVVLVGISVALTFLASTLVSAGFTAVRRWRVRREVRRVCQGGLSRYADPARVHRETTRHLDRLAARPAAADAGAARRVDARGVVEPGAGVGGGVAGVRRDLSSRSREGRADVGDRGTPVSGAAPGMVRDDRAGTYGRGTTLVFPLAAAAQKRVNGSGA